MEKKQLLVLKEELLNAIKQKNKYPVVFHTPSDWTAKDREAIEKKSMKNKKMHDFYSEKINQIKGLMREQWYPIDEILQNWDKALEVYKYDLTTKEKVKLILLGKKFPSLKRYIMEDLDLNIYFDQDKNITNRRNK